MDPTGSADRPLKRAIISANRSQPWLGKPARDGKWRASGFPKVAPDRGAGTRYAEHEAGMNDELRTAFEATTYRVLHPAEAVDIRIGRHNAALDDLLEESAETWAFITAWNPRGAADGRSPTNLARAGELRRACAGFPCHEGVGLAEKGSDHPAEESLFVVGISAAEAVELGV
jgi:hypothetical protein